mmetsp:Transcript_140116/g.355324  ORF Transcript_140116/g.355324 Transcript_140116/m.355324 type:complete len:236 (-) Transcript_140116:69-776(-)
MPSLLAFSSAGWANSGLGSTAMALLRPADRKNGRLVPAPIPSSTTFGPPSPLAELCPKPCKPREKRAVFRGTIQRSKSAMPSFICRTKPAKYQSGQRAAQRPVAPPPVGPCSTVVAAAAARPAPKPSSKPLLHEGHPHPEASSGSGIFGTAISTCSVSPSNCGCTVRGAASCSGEPASGCRRLRAPVLDWLRPAPLVRENACAAKPAARAAGNMLTNLGTRSLLLRHPAIADAGS